MEQVGTGGFLLGAGGCRWVTAGCRWVQMGAGGCRWVQVGHPFSNNQFSEQCLNGYTVDPSNLLNK